MNLINILFCCNSEYKTVLKGVGESCSAWCNIKMIKKEDFDLNVRYEVYFFEVDTCDTTGFEKAKYIKQKYSDSLIIFISPSIELALIGYKYNAFRFLMSDKLKSELPLILTDINKYYEFSNHFINVKDKKNHSISLCSRDIVFIVSEGNYIDIHTEGDIFRKRCTVKHFRHICADEIFAYIEKGILINMRYGTSFNRLTGELLIKSGKHLYVRKNFKATFLKEWNKLKK